MSIKDNRRIQTDSLVARCQSVECLCRNSITRHESISVISYVCSRYDRAHCDALARSTNIIEHALRN